MTKQSSAQVVSDLVNVRAIMERLLSEGNINMIYVLRPLAAQLIADGNYKDAEPVQVAIVALCQRFSSPALPSQADAKIALVETLCRLDKFDQAAQIYAERHCAEVSESGANSERSLSLADSYVHCLIQLARYNEAEAMVRGLIRQIESSQVNPLSWLSRLYIVLGHQGKFAEAAQVCESTLPFYPSEVALIPVLDTIAELYRQAGDSRAVTRIRARRRELAKKYDF